MRGCVVSGCYVPTPHRGDGDGNPKMTSGKIAAIVAVSAIVIGPPNPRNELRGSSRIVASARRTFLPRAAPPTAENLQSEFHFTAVPDRNLIVAFERCYTTGTGELNALDKTNIHAAAAFATRCIHHWIVTIFY